jgi:hypothetical protein
VIIGIEKIQNFKFSDKISNSAKKIQLNKHQIRYNFSFQILNVFLLFISSISLSLAADRILIISMCMFLHFPSTKYLLFLHQLLLATQLSLGYFDGMILNFIQFNNSCATAQISARIK